MAIPQPHGGELKDLIARDASQKSALLSKFETLKHKINLSGRQICDLELILNGGFSPLTGFLSEEDYNSVIEKSRLVNGTLWTIPITLDVSNIDNLKVGEEIPIINRQYMESKFFFIIYLFCLFAFLSLICFKPLNIRRFHPKGCGPFTYSN